MDTTDPLNSDQLPAIGSNDQTMDNSFVDDQLEITIETSKKMTATKLLQINGTVDKLTNEENQSINNHLDESANSTPVNDELSCDQDNYTKKELANRIEKSSLEDEINFNCSDNDLELNRRSTDDKNDDDKHDDSQSTKTKIIIVHLLNGGIFECPITSKSTGKDVFRSTCDYLILREHQYFGLTYRDAENNTRIWLNLNKKINKIIKDNRNSLHFEVKFFPEPTDLEENITRFFLCLQIRNNMIEEKIACSDETYAILGSYLVQSEFGNYDLDKHNDHYLDNFKFAPKPSVELINRLKELHKERHGMSAPAAELTFLQTAKKLSIYGLDFYSAKDSNDISITIGVCSSGLSVYNSDSLCIAKYPWPKISKIAYNLESFFIKIKETNEEGDKSTKTENTVDFKLCSAKAAYDLWKITVEHHTFFKSLSMNGGTFSKSKGKNSSLKKKHESKSKHRKEKSSKHHKSDRSKNRKENPKSSKRDKSDRKAEKSDKKLRKENRNEITRENKEHRETKLVKDHRTIEDKHLKESNKNTDRVSPVENRLRHSSSHRYKQKKEEKPHSRDVERKRRNSNRDMREPYDEAIRRTRKETHRESYRESYRESNRESHRESNREPHRESHRELHKESYREPNKGSHRESHRESNRELNRDSIRSAKESRKEERRPDHDRDHRHKKGRDDKSSERKRHRSKHGKHESSNDRRNPISIAESYYQDLMEESQKYLNEKDELKDNEHKHKKPKRDDNEIKSSPTTMKSDQLSSQKSDEQKKVSNHFIKDIINLGEGERQDADSNDEKHIEKEPNDKIELIKESISANKPGSPPKKDVKLNSKSNVEFDIFWDPNDKNDNLMQMKDSNHLEKSKDDLTGTTESGEKRFIPRVLLNSNEQQSSNSQPANRSFTKFELKSVNRVGPPKTPPDEHFNIFETNTSSNQSLPTPTQDESQNEKFNNESIAGEMSSNANSVRSLSPHSIQLDNPQTNHNNKNHPNNHSTKIANLSSKFEIYDPEAPLESPEQQPLASNNSGLFNKNSVSQHNSFKNNSYGIYSSSSNNNKTNGDNNFTGIDRDMDIDSPFSPSKPINSPATFQQPVKPSTSNISNNQSQPTQITAPALKLVIDHLIKAAQLQQQHKKDSPFKKSSANSQQSTSVEDYRNSSKANNFNSTNNSADDDLPSSAVELNSREKYIKKLNRQERVVDEMKCCLKPYYQRKEITKEEYKNIMRKAVPKICHSKTGEINPTKIRQLVETYIGRMKRERNKMSV